MAPDINSIPAPQSQSQSQPHSPQALASRNRAMAAAEPGRHAHSPLTGSLGVAATLNAGLQNDERRTSNGSMRSSSNIERQRRRSSVRMSLNLNDPALPGPGEMAQQPGPRPRGPSWSLHDGMTPSTEPTRHARAPSLGELHQELENEQEAQVNRLLSMIRQQQAQIQALQSHPPTSSTAIEDSNPPSDVSRSQTPSRSHRAPRPVSASRQNSSALASHSPSPSLRPQHLPSSAAPHYINTSVGLPVSDEFTGFGPSSAVSTGSLRDEAAFYQAETQNLTRENQMLKMRIRELERQVNEMDGLPAGPTHGQTHSPVQHSSLHSATVVEADQSGHESRQTD